MYLSRNSLFHCLCSLPQLQIRLCNYHIVHSYTPHFHKIPPFSHRKFSSSPQIEDPVEPPSETQQTKSQLQNRFKKFVRILRKTGNSESETRNKDLQLGLKQLVEEIWGIEVKPKIEDGEYKENLEKAEQYMTLYSVLTDQPAVKVLEAKPRVEGGENKENLELAKQHKNLCSVFTDQPAVKVLEAKRKVEHEENKENLEKAKKHKSLYSVFAVKVKKSRVVKNREQVVISKVLSPDMEVFLYHLYKQRYFDDANFLKGCCDLDLSLFEHADRREYIKHVAESFGSNNDGLAK